MTYREERIGDARLILARCEDVMSTLSAIGSVVTDPPYGIKRDGQRKSSGTHGGRKAYDFLGWDAARPDLATFNMILAIAPQTIIWGGNYFADLLPPAAGWLVWDKGQRINQSDGELAWTNIGGALRIWEQNRVALLTDGAEHPTQKPVQLMRWCVEKTSGTVLDPFAGSGSTGVACARLGRRFIGIEREERYFNIMCRRIEAAHRQRDLFVAPPRRAAPVQTDMLA